ncbi:MAG: isoprenyl transferase [Clostridiales bacterium]|nr:isoprenyl transferase [Clostridiales bacterium]MBR6986919.1 isoprenyl transferase [Clostridiales bacterium]
MALLGKKQEFTYDTGDLKVPVSLGVIMDGNGRWATKRHLPRSAGHRAGAENLKELCRNCGRYGVKYLTVYAFSTENWARPKDEVEKLMKLFVEFVDRYDPELKDEGVRMRFTGDIAALPEKVKEVIKIEEERSKDRQKMQLIIAFNYGGRREIVNSCQKIAEQIKAGTLEPSDITEQMISDNLYLPDVPDPELIIRPSGELRISNFLLWECAYSEFWVSDVLWPDFGYEELTQAFRDYALRDRRFGGLSKKEAKS